MLSNRLGPPHKPNLQVRASAKNAPIAPRKNNALNAVVYIEHAIRLFQFQHHGVGEGIVVLRAPERQDDDPGVLVVVLRADLRPGEVVVAGWELWRVEGGGHGLGCVGRLGEVGAF